MDEILRLDSERRELVGQVDEARSRSKAAGKTIASATPEERPALVQAQAQEKAALKAMEARQKEVAEALDALLLLVPNVPAEAVPDGATDEDNVEIKRWGEPKAFGFTPRSHSELGEAHNWIDSVRGARLSGSRNYVLLGDMSLLEHAVMRYALDLMVGRGFTSVSVPTVLLRPPRLVRCSIATVGGMPYTASTSGRPAGCTMLRA